MKGDQCEKVRKKTERNIKIRRMRLSVGHWPNLMMRITTVRMVMIAAVVTAVPVVVEMVLVVVALVIILQLQIE
jgi:hypothetical protein